ncbi:MAG: ATP phosphoribosyltransferase regulatory subunit [Lachnospiraceae bacterium]|nr:ATP phosphoribosyltransferase regulatory subunit [Lachnospiraceae bacterium]
MIKENLLHTPEGIRDLYGDEFDKKIRTETSVFNVLVKEGYRKIQTPTLEFADVFSSSIGTTPSNELYRFYDPEGNTLVLRPDFTPSIARCAAKYFMDEKSPIRLCYSGSTFSNTKSLRGKLKEVTQMGAELISDPSVEADGEIIALAINVLKEAGLKKFKITVGNADFYRGICNHAGLSDMVEHDLRDLISQKNIFGAENYLKEQNISDMDKLLKITEFFGSSEILDRALAFADNDRSREAVNRLIKLDEVLKRLGVDGYITYDLSMLSKYDYYTGVIFRAYTYGVGEPIVKGGRYDNLLSYFGKDAPAIGFCVVTDDLIQALDHQDKYVKSDDDRYLTFALGKGRLANKALELLEQMGITCEEMKDKDTRKLIFVNEDLKLKFFLAKGPDVPTYVEYGAADIGVVGKDTIMEENRDVFEVLDLNFGKCRMCVCGPESAQELLKGKERIRVATKYPLIAKEYFYNVRNQTVDIIKLNGSVELGPIVELSDVIVDIVETGSTLRENGLKVLEEIAPLSARMIVNPVSMQMESGRIKDIISKLKVICEEQ